MPKPTSRLGEALPLPTLATLEPMLLSEVKRPFSRPGWGFEIKYDGWRCLAEVKGGEARLQSRRGSDATTWWPEVARSLSTVPGHHIFDGEMCVLDDVGRSDFERLQARSMRRGWKPGVDWVSYCVFDVLVVDGRDVMAQPLRDRKAMLAQLLAEERLSILPVGYIEEEGELLYQQALGLKLEGVVAKDLGSPYVPGVRTADWLKVKRPGAVPAERFKYGKKG